MKMGSGWLTVINILIAKSRLDSVMIMVRQPDSTLSRSACAKSHILPGCLKACIFKFRTTQDTRFRWNDAIAQPAVIPGELILNFSLESGGRGAGIQKNASINATH